MDLATPSLRRRRYIITRDVDDFFSLVRCLRTLVGDTVAPSSKFADVRDDYRVPDPSTFEYLDETLQDGKV